MDRIIISGATGYIGYKVAERFHGMGFDVSVIVRKTSDITKLLDFVKQEDIYVYSGQYEEMEKILREAKPAAVIHLAAFFVAEHEKSQVDLLIDSNVRFSLHLLEAMKNTGVKKMINTSTSWQNYHDEPCNPVSLYAATKQMVEDAIRYYSEAWEMDIVSLVIFDTYGDDDTRHKLFHILKDAAETGKELYMSPGEQKLNYVYISDVVSAYEAAYRKLMSGVFCGNKRYCVQSGENIRLKEIVGLYEKISGKKVPVVWGGREYRKREVMIPYQVGERLPGWTPEVCLEEGIKKVCLGGNRK